MKLFTDSSVSPQNNFGIGGYLLIESIDVPFERMPDNRDIRLKSFEKVTSTDLELKTMIWALSEIEVSVCNLTVYTDSQNILSLLERRERLQANDFKNRSGKLLKHAEIYKTFYALLDKMHFEVIKVKGHNRKAQRNEIERIFSQIDQATRNELRMQLNA